MFLTIRWPGNLIIRRVGAIVCQVTILVLTLLKYKIALKHGWGKLPIMILMVRDGTAAFFILLSTTCPAENLCSPAKPAPMLSKRSGIMQDEKFC